MDCPCCGQPINHIPAPGLRHVKGFGFVAATVIGVLADNYPAGITMDKLVHEVYGSSRNAPEFPVQTLCTTMANLRRKLPKFGWTISKTKGGRATSNRYRLVSLRPIE